ncbi:MAG TPA: hypothetical protein VNL91_11805 [Thermoanaerobaculia bacterium]|nr:hypothetical protein [Thermoanaerobaculia bacterium]
MRLAMLLLIAAPAFAGFPGRHLVVPVAGQVIAAGGREYRTTLWITNPGDEPARAALSFAEGGRPNPEMRSVPVDLQPGQTLRIDNVTATLLAAPGKLGAIFIESDRPLVASARVDSGGGATGAAFAAIPIELAVGRGGTTRLHGAGTGPGGEFRYNLHLVETNRSAVQVAISLVDAGGRRAGRKTILLGDRESVIIPIASLARSVSAEASVVVEVTKGSGKIVAAGSQVAVATGDPTAFEMSFPAVPRPGVPPGEIAIYVLAALAVIIAALRRGRAGPRASDSPPEA